MTSETKETPVHPEEYLDESADAIAAAFNTWMDEYENNPTAFEHELTTIKRHLKERGEGENPSYGVSCLATLKRYIERANEEEKDEASGG